MENVTNEGLKQNLAIFDFCGTLINFETANAFTDFSYKHAPNYNVVLKLNSKVISLIYSLIKQLPVVRNLKVVKKLSLLRLVDFNYEQLTKSAYEFTSELLIPNENLVVVETMKQHIANNDKVIIVSAGYKVYIDIWLKTSSTPFTNVVVIANEISNGKICAKDCIDIEKVERFKSLYKIDDFKLADSCVYSDLESDLTNFDFVKNKFLVKNGVIFKK